LNHIPRRNARKWDHISLPNQLIIVIGDSLEYI
jgi:hypothetical protein